MISFEEAVEQYLIKTGVTRPRGPEWSLSNITLDHSEGHSIDLSWFEGETWVDYREHWQDKAGRMIYRTRREFLMSGDPHKLTLALFETAQTHDEWRQEVLAGALLVS
jgi:hypothetical protein